MLRGQGEVEANLAKWYSGTLAKAAGAMRNVGVLLENYAKAHHGGTPREAGYVYPGGGVARWRPGGIGWGDVTGATQNSTRGYISEATRNKIVTTLSAGMEYDVFLELARDGKWAWLWPAIEENTDRIRDELKGIVR